MSISYDEIMIKFVEGGIVKNLAWVVKNLETDPEVLANASREKVALRKFLTDIQDQFEEFMSDANDDPRNNVDDQDVFGDDDIAVCPGGGTATAFMDPPAQGEDPKDDSDDGDVKDKDKDEDDDGPSFDTGLDFDDGFPKK